MGFVRLQVAVIDRDVAVSLLPPGSNLEVEPKIRCSPFAERSLAI